MSERRGPWNSLSQIVGRIEDLESAVAALLELDWQNSVLSIFDPTAALPAGPSTGDRYISSATANGWTDTYIYEWSGTAWTEHIPNEGWAAWVEDVNKVYVFDSAAWVAIGSTTDHNILANLQGGTASEYYHLTQAIHDALYSGSPIIGMGAVAGTNVEVDYGNHIVTIDLGGEAGLVATKDGSVDLYYDGDKRIETSVGGIIIGVDSQPTWTDLDIFVSAASAFYNVDGAHNMRVNSVTKLKLADTVELNTGQVKLEYGKSNFFNSAGTAQISLESELSDIPNWIIKNEIDSGHIVLRGMDSGSAESDLIIGDPDGAVELYHNGLLKFNTDTQYLNGIQNASDVAVSSDGGTPPTITFTFTGTVYIWSDGIRYAKTGSENIILIDVNGTHVIYYNGSTLTVVANPSHAAVDAIIEDKAIVAIVYWNTNTNVTPVLAGELHGIKMPGATHHYLHDTRGAQYEDGATLSGYTLNTASDVAISFDLTNLEFYDEDIQVDVIDGLASVQYSQVLTGDAEIPVLYKDAVDQSWVEQAASALPYIVGGTPKIQYMDKLNSYALTEVNANKWCSYWLVATNDWQYPIKMIPGDQEYNSINDALQNAPDEILNFGDLPSAEFIVMYQFVMKDSAGGTKNALISAIVDLRESGKSGTAANPATDHGGLTGLGDDDHPQYRLVTDAPTAHGNGSHTSTFITASDVTYANLNGNGDVGVGATQVAFGNHGHAQLHTRLHAVTDILDHSAGNWKLLHSNGAGQVVEIALGADNTYLKSAGAAAAPGFEALDISEDTTPTLGGNLALNGKSIVFAPASLADLTAEGDIVTMTVDVNATGIGATLYMAADFHLEETDADASATMPCIALALETGVGAKQVLLRGFIRDDTWAWTAGPIYVSITTGAMTQTAPSGTGDRVQRVGWAYSADIMFFDPDSTDIGVS